MENVFEGLVRGQRLHGTRSKTLFRWLYLHSWLSYYQSCQKFFFMIEAFTLFLPFAPNTHSFHSKNKLRVNTFSFYFRIFCLFLQRRKKRVLFCLLFINKKGNTYNQQIKNTLKYSFSRYSNNSKKTKKIIGCSAECSIKTLPQIYWHQLCTSILIRPL